MRRLKRKDPVDPKTVCKNCKHKKALCTMQCDINCKVHCICGAPTKMDEETVRKLVVGFQMDFTIEQACVYAEIGRTTYYEWYTRSAPFRYKMEQAQQYLHRTAKAVVAKRIVGEKDDKGRWIQKPDYNAAHDFLKSREKSRYAGRLEISEVLPEDQIDEDEKRDIDKELKKHGL